MDGYTMCDVASCHWQHVLSSSTSSVYWTRPMGKLCVVEDAETSTGEAGTTDTDAICKKKLYSRTSDAGVIYNIEIDRTVSIFLYM